MSVALIILDGGIVDSEFVVNLIGLERSLINFPSEKVEREFDISLFHVIFTNE